MEKAVDFAFLGIPIRIDADLPKDVVVIENWKTGEIAVVRNLAVPACEDGA